MTVGNPAREPHGDPQTHLDTDPVNHPDAPEDRAEETDDAAADDLEGDPQDLPG
ncbi:hypothetical protein GCM10023339_16660 [Alloalcanivorax gelatiniphagus]